MTFDPRFLPAKTYRVYKLGVGAWPLVVRSAIKEGIADLSKLTYIVFCLHHPELGGRPPRLEETGLIKQWKLVEALVRPLVPPSSRVTLWDHLYEIPHSPIPSTSDPQLWTWHEAARMFSYGNRFTCIPAAINATGIWYYDPQFTGGVFVATR